MFETLSRLNNTLNNILDPILITYGTAGLIALAFFVLTFIENRRLDKERQKRAHS